MWFHSFTLPWGILYFLAPSCGVNFSKVHNTIFNWASCFVFTQLHSVQVLLYTILDHMFFQCSGTKPSCNCLCLFSALQASWTQQCGSVKAGVVGLAGCRAARWSWVTSNKWMLSLLNIQERWRLATIHRCPQSEPADLTLTLSASVCVSVFVCTSVHVCVRASASEFAHHSSQPAWQPHNRGLFSAAAPNSG